MLPVDPCGQPEFIAAQFRIRQHLSLMAVGQRYLALFPDAPGEVSDVLHPRQRQLAIGRSESDPASDLRDGDIQRHLCPITAVTPNDILSHIVIRFDLRSIRQAVFKAGSVGIGMLGGPWAQFLEAIRHSGHIGKGQVLPQILLFVDSYVIDTISRLGQMQGKVNHLSAGKHLFFLQDHTFTRLPVSDPHIHFLNGAAFIQPDMQKRKSGVQRQITAGRSLVEEEFIAFQLRVDMAADPQGPAVSAVRYFQHRVSVFRRDQRGLPAGTSGWQRDISTVAEFRMDSA